MAKRKTAADYEADIATLHKQLPDPSVEKKIARRIKKWMELAPIRVQVANNEKKPWTPEMLGYPVERMSLKKDIGINQVGDYQGIIETSAGDKYIGIVIERKSVEDCYNTLITEDDRARFYREIERFKSDNRFNKLMIIVEGTLSDFILYQPKFNADGFDYARRFDTNKNNTINEKKMTVVSDLLIMNVHVLFCDNPALSAQMCGRIFRESVRKNYVQILGL